MAGQGDSLIRKTQKGLSVLAFETSKQTRILKKRMRIAALQKEIKTDLRDLGNLVYNAVVNGHTEVLQEEEVQLLVESIRKNKEEIQHLREAIARLSRARKHFPEGEEPEEEAPEPGPDEPELATVEPSEAEAPRAETPTDEARDVEEAVLEPAAAEKEPQGTAGATEPEESEASSGQVPPPPGTDPGRPEPGTDDRKKPQE